jgi:hypothetical protein
MAGRVTCVGTEKSERGASVGRCAQRCGYHMNDVKEPSDALFSTSLRRPSMSKPRLRLSDGIALRVSAQIAKLSSWRMGNAKRSYRGQWKLRLSVTNTAGSSLGHEFCLASVHRTETRNCHCVTYRSGTVQQFVQRPWWNYAFGSGEDRHSGFGGGHHQCRCINQVFQGILDSYGEINPSMRR